MCQKNIIIWEKWYDPFGFDDEDQDTLQDEDKEYSNDYYDEEQEEEHQEEDIKETNKKYNTEKKNIKVIATPMGVIPINEHTASGKIFNFWVGHTNFNISTITANIIESSEGVETLDIFTRYRFRISVGKAFSDSKILREISSRICDIYNE